jgi:hypothetical protein
MSETMAVWDGLGSSGPIGKSVNRYSAERPVRDTATYLPDTRGLQPFAL